MFTQHEGDTGFPNLVSKTTFGHLSQQVPAPALAPAPVQVQGSSVVPIHGVPKAAPAKVLQGAIPSGHIPKPVIVPDYIA